MTRLTRRRLQRFRNSAWPKLIAGLSFLALAHVIWGMR